MMTRKEAKDLLASGKPIDYVQLDDILRAFGCEARSPDDKTEVYFHRHAPCGLFPARDNGLQVLSPDQVDAVIGMMVCIEKWEAVNDARHR